MVSTHELSITQGKVSTLQNVKNTLHARNTGQTPSLLIKSNLVLLHA